MVLGPEIRPAAAADLPQMAALLNAIIRTGGTTAIETPLDEAALAAWFLDPPGAVCCHVALDAAGRVLGFQSVGANPDLPPGTGDMASFVAEGLTGRGIGSALFAATRAAARGAGLTALNATIRADNTGGLAYYARLGFADHAVSRAVPLADGTPVDRIHKRLALG